MTPASRAGYARRLPAAGARSAPLSKALPPMAGSYVDRDRRVRCSLPAAKPVAFAARARVMMGGNRGGLGAIRSAKRDTN